MAMIFTRRTKVVLLLSLLVVVSVGVGFFLGIVLSSVINKKKEDPAFWKQAATKHLEKLHPTDEQRKKFEARTDSAVQELSTLQKEGITRIWDVINRATADIDKELTPEQRDIFEKIKPREKSEQKK
jgi:cell division protein FtsN